MAISPTAETVTGRVASVNPKGVRLDGHDDWFNFSKFADDIVPPERGQTVTLSLDRSGFVRSVSISEAGPSASLAPRGAQSASSGQQRDTTITRLAVLKAAAEFGASRPDLKSSDVLLIAASWETWVNRPLTDDDFEDAF